VTVRFPKAVFIVRYLRNSFEQIVSHKIGYLPFCMIFIEHGLALNIKNLTLLAVVLGVPEFVYIIFRANLVDRDPAPLGYQLVNPDQSGKRTQMDLGRYGTGTLPVLVLVKKAPKYVPAYLPAWVSPVFFWTLLESAMFVLLIFLCKVGKLRCCVHFNLFFSHS
jgi:hypothetical protein